MRKTSLGYIILGAFLIIAAPLVKFYAYPRLAVAPANVNTVTMLQAKGATIFSADALKDITTDLKITVKTSGDASTPSSCPNAVTYVNSTTIDTSSGLNIPSQIERETFNRTTGESVPNCGLDFVSNETGKRTYLSHHGLTTKFPFNTQKKSYEFWDSTLLSAAPVSYEGTSSIQGLSVYKFHQNIPATKYGTRDIPVSLFGLSGTNAVAADEMYSVDRTLWVEPNTGVIIQRSEAQNSYVTYQGHDLTLSRATVSYTPDTVNQNVNDYGSQGKVLKFVRTPGPIVALLLGLILVLIGVSLGRHKISVDRLPRLRDREHASV